MLKFASIGSKSMAVRHQTYRFASHSFNRSFLSQPYTSLGGIISFLIGALIIFTLSVKDNRAVHHLNVILLDMTAPLVDVVTKPFTVLASCSDIFHTHQKLRIEVSSLRETNDHLLSLVQSLRQQAFDHQQLQQLTKVVPDIRVDRISARVIGRVSDGMNALLTIKANESHGIAKNQVVLTAEGVVGRISEVGGFSPHTARVMPLTDLSSRIPVEIEATQEHGVIAGQNGPELRLIHLEKQAKVKVGDRLVTSGYGGIFPRGLLVAIVTNVTSQTISARPLVKETPAFVTILLGP